jgi:transposase
MPRPPGRPSLHTPALAEAICARLADGESLRAICRDAAMPCAITVLQWARDDRGGFAALYRRAREDQAHTLAELAVEAALSATGPQAARLHFDALRWYASKLLPKVYGDRVEVEQTVRAVVSDEPMTLDEWTEKYGDTSSPRGAPTEAA